MKIEILTFIPDKKNMREGYFDFRVDYPEGKWEIFRNASYFVKGDRSWVTLGSCRRNEQWVARYERSSNLRELFAMAASELKKFLEESDSAAANPGFQENLI